MSPANVVVFSRRVDANTNHDHDFPPFLSLPVAINDKPFRVLSRILFSFQGASQKLNSKEKYTKSSSTSFDLFLDYVLDRIRTRRRC